MQRINLEGAISGWELFGFTHVNLAGQVKRPCGGIFLTLYGEFDFPASGTTPFEVQISCLSPEEEIRSLPCIGIVTQVRPMVLATIALKGEMLGTLRQLAMSNTLKSCSIEVEKPNRGKAKVYGFSFTGAGGAVTR